MMNIRPFKILSIVVLLLAWGCGESGSQNSGADKSSQPGKSPSSLTSRDLIAASLEGNMQAVKKALGRDMDINGSDGAGRTPLMMAAYNGHRGLVEYLLREGADLNAADKQGRTPLIFAASGPNPKTVELLLAKGSKPNIADKNEGWTALMWAAAEGNREVVRILLDHGADPSLEDKDKETAVDFAESNGHEHTAKLLKKAVGGK